MCVTLLIRGQIILLVPAGGGGGDTIKLCLRNFTRMVESLVPVIIEGYGGPSVEVKT